MAVALKPMIDIKPPSKQLLTLADFDALPEGPPDYEFEGGRLIDMPRPHPRHQKIIMRLGAVFDEHISRAAIGAVWPEIDVQLSRRRVYVPDLVYLAKDEHSAFIEPLYLPGAVFVVVVIATIFLHHLSRGQVKVAVTASARTLAGSAIALGAAVPMVRIFINSGVNEAGLASMPIDLAGVLAGSISHGWPVVAPIVGSLGSFISGSATFSNMMFSLLQFSVAEQAGLSPLVVLAMQVLGANAGNMICVVNVVAAASVVKLLGQEGAIIRLTLGPMLYYALWAGILGLALTLLL